jgi:aminopeptidase N
MANYLKRYPGENSDLVQRLIQAKNQAQITGQVNPDLAPIVAGTLADQRDANYKDSMLGLQERGLTLAQQKQAAQENQFAQSLAQGNSQFTSELDFQKKNTEDLIAAANRARIQGYINTGLGAALAGTQLATYDPNKYRRYYNGV